MGCGCAKTMARSKRKKQEAISKNAKEQGRRIRKRRVNRLIAIPGKSSRRKTEET